MGLVDGGNASGGWSIADVMALTNSENGGIGGNTWIWLFFLFFLFTGGNGFGAFGGRSVAPESELTRAEMMKGFADQNFMVGQDSIQRSLAELATAGAINAGQVKYDNLVGLNTITAAMAEQAAAQAKCCCETNRNIDAVRYENAQNTAAITHNAELNTRDILASQNAGFQRILDFMTNDKIEGLRSELQAAQLQIGNMSQTASLLNSLRPYPQPAYITASPYAGTPYGAIPGYSPCGC